MSANNYILIKEVRNGFNISHRDMDTDKVLGKTRKTKTLRDAVIESDALKREWWPVEYGVDIRLRKEKK